ncbi:MAG TPA: serine/threonine-protein kinase [Polyangiaceae bacterium]|jgi:serine/threonine-protein kinase|nr:serine/threonine-protein kinase [Polyangiaceae bacterium]
MSRPKPSTARDAWLLLDDAGSAPPTIDAAVARDGVPDEPLAVGSLFARRFRIVRFIARGGMGTVWEATDTVADDPAASRIALKILTSWAQASPAARERFRREAALVAGLTGPCFPKVIARGIEGNIPYLALELLEGETLAQRLARVGKLSPDECATLATNVAAALQQAHSLGIVHRDVSPQNIFLLREPAGALKILDFGIAKHVVFDSKLTEPGALMGTAHFMSPEQVRKAQAVDARADLWAMAAILYRALLGRRPFEGNAGEVLLKVLRDTPTPPSQLGSFGPDLDAFFYVALAKDPGSRFSNATILATTFVQALAGATGDVRTPRPGEAAPADIAERTMMADADYRAYAHRASHPDEPDPKRQISGVRDVVTRLEHPSFQRPSGDERSMGGRSPRLEMPPEPLSRRGRFSFSIWQLALAVLLTNVVTFLLCRR